MAKQIIKKQVADLRSNHRQLFVKLILAVLLDLVFLDYSMNIGNM
jgi:hypothetical protein